MVTVFGSRPCVVRLFANDRVETSWMYQPPDCHWANSRIHQSNAQAPERPKKPRIFHNQNEIQLLRNKTLHMVLQHELVIVDHIAHADFLCRKKHLVSSKKISSASSAFNTIPTLDRRSLRWPESFRKQHSEGLASSGLKHHSETKRTKYIPKVVICRAKVIQKKCILLP